MLFPSLGITRDTAMNIGCAYLLGCTYLFKLSSFVFLNKYLDITGESSKYVLFFFKPY